MGGEGAEGAMGRRGEGEIPVAWASRPRKAAPDMRRPVRWTRQS
jgi:hypothetical protein